MSRRAWLLFAGSSLVWGSSFLWIKIAVEELSPAAMTFARCALGALLLLPFALRSGALGQLRGRLPDLAVLAAFDVVAPFTLTAAGERTVSSSLAGILIASNALFVALLALAVDRSERVSGGRLVGLAAGFLGVMALFGFETGGGRLGGALMVLAASLCYAGATLYYKRRWVEAEPIAVVTGMLAISAVGLAPAAILTAPERVPSGGAVGAVLALTVLGTTAGYLLFYRLIAEAGASRASVITYALPAVAVVLGVLFLDESVGLSALGGLALILAGSWLATGGRLVPAHAGVDSGAPHG